MKMALNINKREKIAVVAAACAIFIFILLQFLVFPLFDKRERLSTMLSARQQELVEIRLLQAEYRQTHEKINRAQRFLKARQPGFTLFSFLETLAGQTGVKSHIAYMRPNTTVVKESPYRLSMVEMKLQEITMSQLLAYLHGIETSRNMISVKRLSVSKGERKTDLINAVFQVQTMEQ
jgi:general secretion pathway protein M